MSKLGVVVIATNAYFELGLRCVRTFSHFSTEPAHFYFFADQDPGPYLSEEHTWLKTDHENWTAATDSKFDSFLHEAVGNEEYLWYFDADTKFHKEFTLNLDGLVAVEHFLYGDSKPSEIPLERNPISQTYVEINESNKYFLGAAYGGLTRNVKDFAILCKRWLDQDHSIGHEPRVNDESASCKFFNMYPPDYTYKFNDFYQFCGVSDKAGLEHTRNGQRRDIDLSSLVGYDGLFTIKDSQIEKIE